MEGVLVFGRRNSKLIFVLMGAIVAVALLWAFTPLKEFTHPSKLVGAIRGFAQESPFAFPVLSLAIGVGNLLLVPINILLVAVAIVFKGWKGFFCGMAGAVIAALLQYYVGRFIGGHRAKERFGEKFEIVSQEIADNGLSAVVVLSLVPIAPNIVTNIVAGICGIPLWKLITGTIIGFLPGLVILNLLSREMRLLFTHQGTFGTVMIGLGLVGLLVLSSVIGKRYKKRMVEEFHRKRENGDRKTA